MLQGDMHCDVSCKHFASSVAFLGTCAVVEPSYWVMCWRSRLRIELLLQVYDREFFEWPGKSSLPVKLEPLPVGALNAVNEAASGQGFVPLLHMPEGMRQHLGHDLDETGSLEDTNTAIG